MPGLHAFAHQSTSSFSKASGLYDYKSMNKNVKLSVSVYLAVPDWNVFRTLGLSTFFSLPPCEIVQHGCNYRNPFLM
jgi:hypothetical protein